MERAAGPSGAPARPVAGPDAGGTGGVPKISVYPLEQAVSAFSASAATQVAEPLEMEKNESSRASRNNIEAR